MKLNLVADAGFTRWLPEDWVQEIKEDVDDMLRQYGAYGIVVEVKMDD